MLRMQNQAKLRSCRATPRHKFGFELPRNNDYDHAIELDAKNGNHLWRDAVKLEMEQQHDYNTHEDKGFQVKPPPGHKKIKFHFAFDVKYDRKHKARLVADGNLTEVPLTSVYSGVVSLRGIRLVLFLAELNGLESWTTGIGNACLEALTKEKVYVIAGRGSGELEGHLLIIKKALHGLRTSGLRWHERLADCLRNMNYLPCRMEPDIWKFKLKGTGNVKCHLGCNFFRDDYGALCSSPKKYLERMESSCVSMFGSKPKTNVSSPVEHGDHPELDTADFLDNDGMQKCQSMVGALQWAVSIGRFDINTAVMTMSSFRVEPR